jgi:hypothetical protein
VFDVLHSGVYLVHGIALLDVQQWVYSDLLLFTELCSGGSCLHLGVWYFVLSTATCWRGHWTQTSFSLLNGNHPDNDRPMSLARPAKPVHLKARQINFRVCTFFKSCVDAFSNHINDSHDAASYFSCEHSVMLIPYLRHCTAVKRT